MTRKEFLRRYFPRFAASLAIIAILVYTVYHVLGSAQGGLMTLPVRHIDDKQILSATAYLFREETVLTVPQEGLVQELTSSGTKVSKETAVAEVHTFPDGMSPEAAQLRLDAINRSIAVLENSKLPANVTLQQAEVYRAQATEAALEIRRALEQNDWKVIAALQDEMLVALNRYAALTGDRDELEQTLTQLKEERAQLLEGLATIVRNTEASGYYYNRSYVDGYETVFTTEALNGLTPAALDALAEAQPAHTDGFAVGKMAYGYDWYLAFNTDAAGAAWFEEGDTLECTFPNNEDLTLRLVCHRIVSEEDRTTVILRSNDIPADFLYLRSQTVEITVDSCSGYYIPSSALHTVDGVEGVYVFRDSTARFCPIQILYRGDGYCIADEHAEGDNTLSLNDILITGGDRLYDGKVY